MVKLKKSGKAKSTKATAEAKNDPANDPNAGGLSSASPAAEVVQVEDVDFAGEGKSFFHVIKGNHSAICKGNSKEDARGAFFKLFGILSTEERVRVGEVDEDDLESFRLNQFGVILGTN